MIRKFSDIIIRLLFPTRCINCAREGKILCEDCLSLISLLDINCCPNCGSDKVSMPGKFCHLCQKKLSLDGVISAVNYQDPIVKKAIFLFKSPPFIKELAKPLSSLIVSQLKLQDNNFDGFILSYIPLDKSSLYHRGFNQSKLLAYELGKSLNLPTYELLKKTRETKPQKSLNKEERKENVKNAFKRGSQSIKGRRHKRGLGSNNSKRILGFSKFRGSPECHISSKNPSCLSI